MKIKSTILFAGLSALVAITSVSAKADLITNGGFETGDFTGWVLQHEAFPFAVGSAPSFPVHSGNFAAQIAGFDFDQNVLTQAIVGSVAGQTYTLTFWFQQSNAQPNGLSVTWNGNTIYSETNNGHSYQPYSFNVLATGSDTLSFVAYNNPSFAYLDDVSLNIAAVPEPSTWAMLILGFASLGYFAHRRRHIAQLGTA